MGVFIVIIGAFILGFAAHRASLCTVKAVAEVMTSGHFYMLASFLKTTVWILALSVLGFALLDVSTPVVRWPLTIWPFVGGLLFGVGAAINGGCTFSTLAKLGDGDMNFAATVAGWVAGAWMERSYFTLHEQAPQRLDFYDLTGGAFASFAIAAAFIWLVWQAIVIIQPFPLRGSLTGAILAPNYKLSAAAALIASVNLVLYDNLGSWSFTSVILSTTAPMRFPAASPLPLLWLVLAFALAGMATSSRFRKTFSYKALEVRRVATHGAAGFIMGVGAAMIPGGNDSLILYGVGFLSPHAIAGFLSILAGIAVAFVAARLFGASPPAVYCSGDVCMSLPEGPMQKKTMDRHGRELKTFSFTVRNYSPAQTEPAGTEYRHKSKKHSSRPVPASTMSGIFCIHKTIRTRLRAWSLLRRFRRRDK